jgi:hypothetical protein
MTPRKLKSKVAKLPALPPITTGFERALDKVGTWKRSRVWYCSQKEHWLGWLREYNGPGYYDRKVWERTAEFIYNHIVCPPMVLWLGEASRVPKTRVREAQNAALVAKLSLASQAAAIRRIIPWKLIEKRLMDKVTATIKREWLREIAAGRKQVEYREIKPYWTRRLSEVEAPFLLRLINGMEAKAPEITVVVQRVRRNARSGCFELHLGKVIDLRHWDLKRERPTNRD